MPCSNKFWSCLKQIKLIQLIVRKLISTKHMHIFVWIEKKPLIFECYLTAASPYQDPSHFWKNRIEIYRSGNLKEAKQIEIEIKKCERNFVDLYQKIKIKKVWNLDFWNVKSLIMNKNNVSSGIRNIPTCQQFRIVFRNTRYLIPAIVASLSAKLNSFSSTNTFPLSYRLNKVDPKLF